MALAEKHQSYSQMEKLVQTPPYYVWEVDGKPISIRLDYDVVDRLSMEVMRGFGAVPKRGAEVGGLLLGTIEVGDKVIVHIEDFEPVTCDYKRGPSFQLSGQDEERFAGAVERNANTPQKRIYAVGYFRSHTREGLGLTDEDIELFHRYFTDPYQVILMVRPYATKVSMAGFFFEEEDGFRRESSYQEFPFRRRELGGGSTPYARNAGTAENMASEGAREDATARTQSLENGKDFGGSPAEPGNDDLRGWMRGRGDSPAEPGGKNGEEVETSSARFRGKWVWIPLSFVFLLLGVIVGFQAALILNKGDAKKIALQSLSLSLSAQKDGDTVVVRWDRASAAVQNSIQGLLQIQDGDFKKTITLDPTRLQNGSVIYRSADSKVSFRLEVQTAERGSIYETVEYDPTRK